MVINYLRGHYYQHQLMFPNITWFLLFQIEIDGFENAIFQSNLNIVMWHSEQKFSRSGDYICNFPPLNRLILGVFLQMQVTSPLLMILRSEKAVQETVDAFHGYIDPFAEDIAKLHCISSGATMPYAWCRGSRLERSGKH